MKTSFILLCLALFAVAAFVNGCNPNENGMPICTGDSTGKFRNNFDPTHYWVCEGNTAVSVPCEVGGFDAAQSNCIAWSTWKWTDPCPESS